MSLVIFTARIDGQPPDPDDIDITRAGANVYRKVHRLPPGVLAPGEAWAPTWRILNPALAARKLGGEAAEQAWVTYVEAFTCEIRDSYKRRRPAWDGLLARPRVVLRCKCRDRARCHRGLVAGILVKLGAVDHGELPAATRHGRLPGLE